MYISSVLKSQRWLKDVKECYVTFAQCGQRICIVVGFEFVFTFVFSIRIYPSELAKLQKQMEGNRIM